MTCIIREKEVATLEGLDILTNIAIVLLLGLLGTLLAKKAKISNVLVLVLIGMFLQLFVVNGNQLFKFSPVFLVSVSVLAIVMIVFDGTSRFKWKDLDEVSVVALRLTGWFGIANIVLLSFIAMLLIFGEFRLMSYLYAMIFASVMIATDPSSLMVMMGSIKNKVISFLEVESLINTPITVIVPFIILELVDTMGELDFVSSFLYQVLPFLQQIVVGVGAGVMVGVIAFKIMKNVYSEQLSPIGLITAALLSYILAENMGGNGVLSVAVLGLFFGSVYVKQKSTLQEFSYMLSNSLEILVFVLVGLMISVPLTFTFLAKSLLIFLALLLCRAGAVFYALREDHFNMKEKLFTTLNMPKGIAMAVVVFTLSVFDVGAVNFMLDYMLAIMVYSLILSTIVVRNSKRFIRMDIQKRIEKA